LFLTLASVLTFGLVLTLALSSAGMTLSPRARLRRRNGRRSLERVSRRLARPHRLRQGAKPADWTRRTPKATVPGSRGPTAPPADRPSG